jgi:hypothetical protein
MSTDKVDIEEIDEEEELELKDKLDIDDDDYVFTNLIK